MKDRRRMESLNLLCEVREALKGFDTKVMNINFNMNIVNNVGNG